VDISAFIFSQTRQASRSASGFGDFNESLMVHPIQFVDGGRWAAQGEASQKSSLTSDAFKFSGKLYAQATHVPNAGGTAHAVFDVTFDVTESANYALSGTLKTTSGPTAGSLKLTLLDGDKLLFSTPASDSPFSQGGALSPGSYRLLMDATGDGSSSVGGGIEYNATFSAAPAAAAIPLPLAVWSGLIVMMIAWWTKLRSAEAKAFC
jgi:hypothetical protein